MMKKYVSTFYFLLRLALVSPVVLASTFAFGAEREVLCRVVSIADGDTLTCLHNRTQIKVRLQHIDAPESAQPYGNQAKQALAQLVFKRNVRLVISGYDRYQRALGVVFDGNRNINLALVEQGMAWAYRQTQPIYRQAQSEAERRRVGLWRDSHPIEPSEWRKRSNSENNFPTLQRKSQNSPLGYGGVNCNVKRSCNQMRNYQEALLHFQQCGWKEMDGNNDGIPCNKLYRRAQQGK